MKMGIFFGNLFWGILIVLFGSSLILKEFGFHFPVVKIFIAVIIILFGVKLLVGGSCKSRRSGITHKSISGNKIEYATIFASQDYDLTNLKQDSKPLEITVVFGSGRVILPAELTVEITPTTVFGATILPNNSYVGFGNDAKRYGADRSIEPVYIEANCVFGRLEFVFQTSKDESGSPQTDSLSTEAERGTDI